MLELNYEETSLYQQQVEELLADKLEKEALVSVRDEQIRAYDQRIDAYECELRSCQDRIRQMAEDSAAAQKSLEDSVQRRFVEQKAGLDAIIADQAASLEAVVGELAAAKKKCEDLETETVNKQQIINERNQQLVELQQQVKESSGELEELKLAARASSGPIIEHQKAIFSLKAQLNGYVEAANKMHDENRTLVEAVKQMRLQNFDLKTENERLKEQMGGSSDSTALQRTVVEIERLKAQ